MTKEILILGKLRPICFDDYSRNVEVIEGVNEEFTTHGMYLQVKFFDDEVHGE